MANRMRLGLLCANVTGACSPRAHLPARKVDSDFELTAVCTSKADSAEVARRAHGARFAFDDLPSMACTVRVPTHDDAGTIGRIAAMHVSLLREGILARHRVARLGRTVQIQEDAKGPKADPLRVRSSACAGETI